MKKIICEFCGEYEKCICTFETCWKCGKSYSNFDPDENHQIFEYRGTLGCSKCIDEVTKDRDFQRAEVIEELNHKSAPFKGLDMSPNSVIGKINRKLLKSQIEILKKEPMRVRNYERPITPSQG